MLTAIGLIVALAELVLRVAVALAKLVLRVISWPARKVWKGRQNRNRAEKQ